MLKEGVKDRVNLFKGVQTYLVGAVIVGLSAAVAGEAGYIVYQDREHNKDKREWMQYIMDKNDKLEENLQINRELNRTFVDKADKATEVIKKTAQPKTSRK